MAEPMFKGLTPGHAQGYLLGGCLSLLSSILGTSFCPDFRGAVLFFEDVGEEPYRIDQYLAHLKNAGVLEHVVGIISGKFKDCEPKNDSPSLSLEETLKDYFIPLNKPTIQNFDYGHGDIKYTLPLGIKVGMDSSLDKIELLEAAVAD
ncbi:MAG: hypothetical protein D6814_07620 [Calditrichaeota bacterium]|nr:MAG: hypothetical protein D6814_07620 [Calditrichota bacterium]